MCSLPMKPSKCVSVHYNNNNNSDHEYLDSCRRILKVSGATNTFMSQYLKYNLSKIVGLNWTIFVYLYIFMH